MGLQDTINLCKESARQRAEKLDLDLHDLISYTQDYMNARIQYEKKLTEVKALCKILSAVKIEVDSCRNELPLQHQVIVTIDHRLDKEPFDIESCNCTIVTQC